MSSGKYLKEQQSGTSNQHQYKMKSILSTAFARFHDSLDQIEMELRRTQTVLRRDVALMQADRLKREREEAAERQRLAAKKSAVQQTESADALSTANDQPESTTKVPTTEQPQPEQADPSNAAKPPPAISTSSAPAPDPLFDGTPATDTAQDTFDFEAMFGDISGGGDHAAVDDNGNGDTSNTDHHFNLNDSEPSLLRGLEDFAKSSGDGGAAGGIDQTNTNLTLDFEMPDLHDTSSTQPENQPATTKPAEPTSTTQGQTAETNGSNVDMTMNDDLDDLFNMDYENPETTEFDNAFFGFGE